MPAYTNPSRPSGVEPEQVARLEEPVPVREPWVPGEDQTWTPPEPDYETQAGSEHPPPPMRPRLKLLGIRKAAEVPVEPVLPLILDRIAPGAGELTMLFGPGDAGKGTLAAAWVAALSQAGMSILVADYEGHVSTEWRPRLGSLGTDVDSVYLWEPRKRDGPDRMRAIWDESEELAHDCCELRIDLLVIDSIQGACLGSSILEDVTVARFMAAIQPLGVPVLAIGHVTKQHDMRYPFGSVYWNSECRDSWSLERPDPYGTEAMLTMRKSNQRRRFGPYAVTFEYGDDGLPVAVLDRELAIRTVAERIAAVFQGWEGEADPTTAEVAAAVRGDGHGSAETETVRKTLSRELGLPTPRWVQVGTVNRNRWRVTADAQTVTPSTSSGTYGVL